MTPEATLHATRPVMSRSFFDRPVVGGRVACRPGSGQRVAAWRVVCVVVGLVATGATGCATTIVETTETTVCCATRVVAGTSLAAASPLTEMVERTLGLGNLIVEGDSRAEYERIAALWTEGRTGVGPEIAREIDHQLELLDIAVTRHRPADADKAANNLAALVSAASR